jgi:hypothetical protein
VAGLSELASQVQRRLPALSLEEAAEIAAGALADGLVVALANAGWELTADINETLRCRLGDHVLEPLDEVVGMVEGTHLPAAWAARSQALGIADLPLRP